MAESLVHVSISGDGQCPAASQLCRPKEELKPFTTHGVQSEVDKCQTVPVVSKCYRDFGSDGLQKTSAQEIRLAGE